MFDIEKVICNQNEPSYRVRYYVYKDNTPYTEYFTKEMFEHKNLKYKKNNSTACFSQLSSMLCDFANKHEEWPNRLLFLCNFEHYNNTIDCATYDERLWWITTCKKYKLLPDYIGIEFVRTGNFIMRISNIDLNTLYVYLSIARYLQETPHFVKAIKYLVEDKNMDFYIAFAVASRCCVSGIGHHVIPISKQYPYTSEKRNSINNIDTYNLDEVTRLKKFLEDRESIKKTTLKDIALGTSLGRFNLHNTLSKIKTKGLVVTHKELLSKDTIRKFMEN